MPFFFFFPLPDGWRWIDAGGACSCGYELWCGWPPKGCPGSDGRPEFSACDGCSCAVVTESGAGRPTVIHTGTRGSDGEIVWTTAAL